MQTITLKVSDSAYQQLMELLEKISPNELEIVGNEHFNALKAAVQSDYAHSKENMNTSISIDELEENLNAMLEKYGD
ncbi:hypothetical protein SYJ56_23670 [Algoriphagus sp. D3-2-R+10]|uniref:hypothetical protein n=1 Tax=Algoriphagus aurantiacus TaxID=3103948 RepID=UPI002B3CB259|nr:hypothetical protein [Algoriphagus sp. D3-2-R+10]MEB2778330.1 hypothetical protein [Algoriphagus sp. D3-2-R+10]